jgi:hypothetical protein
MVFFTRTNLMLADFAMSMDILAWDESGVEDRPNIRFFARLDPNSVIPTDVYAYGGAAAMRWMDNPNQSAIWLTEFTGANHQPLGDYRLFQKTDPAKDYRLVFFGAGSVLTVQLFNLTDGSPPLTYQFSDNTLTEGWVGFMVWERGPSGTLDFTLDNFVAVGTSPPAP